MKIEFPPPIFRSRPLRGEVLVWSPTKGLRKEKREEEFRFPPTIIELEFRTSKKGK